MASVSTTYPYKIGPVNWNGREMNAVIIAGLPREGGFVASILADRILAENLDISAEPARWAVFARLPPRMPGAKWQLIGSGSGTRALPEDDAPSGDIPEKVVRQLEEIFGV